MTPEWWRRRFRLRVATGGMAPASAGLEAYATVFDRMAPRYDALWTTSAIGRAQRNQVWRVVDRLFQPGERVLDIGCGTGEDAAHLAGRGLRVHATDASPAMVEVARARGGFTVEVCPAEDL